MDLTFWWSSIFRDISSLPLGSQCMAWQSRRFCPAWQTCWLQWRPGCINNLCTWLQASGVLVEQVGRACLNLTLDDVIPDLWALTVFLDLCYSLPWFLWISRKSKTSGCQINSKSTRPLVPTLVYITVRNGFLVRVSFLKCFVLCYFTWQCCWKLSTWGRACCRCC